MDATYEDAMVQTGVAITTDDSYYLSCDHSYEDSATLALNTANTSRITLSLLTLVVISHKNQRFCLGTIENILTFTQCRLGGIQ